MELEGCFEEMSPGRWVVKEAAIKKRAREGFFLFFPLFSSSVVLTFQL
jgi:hypothetical protein